MNRSTVLVGIAIVLGLLGTVLGFVALGSSDDGYDDLTLELRGGEEIRSESSALHAEPENQPTSYGAEQKVSGDRTGEYIRVCEPVADDNFQCIGSFLLEDGSITFSGTSKDENPVVNAVTGGTGAYAGRAARWRSTTSRTRTSSSWACRTAEGRRKNRSSAARRAANARRPRGPMDDGVVLLQRVVDETTLLFDNLGEVRRDAGRGRGRTSPCSTPSNQCPTMRP